MSSKNFFSSLISTLIASAGIILFFNNKLKKVKNQSPAPPLPSLTNSEKEFNWENCKRHINPNKCRHYGLCLMFRGKYSCERMQEQFNMKIAAPIVFKNITGEEAQKSKKLISNQNSYGPVGDARIMKRELQLTNEERILKGRESRLVIEEKTIKKAREDIEKKEILIRQSLAEIKSREEVVKEKERKLDTATIALKEIKKEVLRKLELAERIEKSVIEREKKFKDIKNKEKTDFLPPFLSKNPFEQSAFTHTANKNDIKEEGKMYLFNDDVIH
jgi:hypothetical protein